MQMTNLGATSVRVSKICLGTMTFGEQNSEADAHSQLDYALERGINFIDTAEMYPVMPRAETQGLTEQYIGSWFKKSGNRSKMVLATKVAGPNASQYWMRGGKNNLDATNIRAAVEASLTRLQTDHIELYQLHWPSRNVPIFGATSYDPHKERDAVLIEDTLAALGQLIDAGKIGHIGVSNETPWGLCEFIRQSENKGLPRIATVQNLYNLAARNIETSFMDEICHRDTISVLAYSPLSFGQLTGKYLDNPQAHGRLTIFPANWSPRYLRPSVVAAVKEYAALARANGMTPTQLALAWCYTRWFVASTIIGATTMAQLEENIDAFEVTLSDDVVDAVNDIHRRITNPGA